MDQQKQGVSGTLMLPRANWSTTLKKWEGGFSKGNLFCDLPAWLEKFTENSVHGEASAVGKQRQSILTSRLIQNAHQEWHRDSTAYLRTFPKSRIAKSAGGPKITRSQCRKRTGNQVHRAEKFGDLSTADLKGLFLECQSRNSHRYACDGTRLGHSVVAITAVQDKDFTGNGKESSEISRAVSKSKSQLY